MTRDPRSYQMRPQPGGRPSHSEALPFPVRVRLRMAQAAMLLERVWPALWPPLALLLVFFSLSFVGLWQALPFSVHALILFALIIGTGFLVWRNVSAAQLPRRRESLRRLEEDSGLKHRPLSALEDRPALGTEDRMGKRLWRAHRARLAEHVRHVGLVLPRTQSDRHDPYALRLLLVLALGVSLVIAGTEWGHRLRDAFAPLLPPPLPADTQVDAWIEPPAYTGLARISLARPDGPGAKPAAVVEVPEGARLVVRASGFPAGPTLVLHAENGPRASTRRSRLRGADGVVETRLPVHQAARADLLYRGERFGAWALSVRADTPPEITMTAPPEATGTASLRFSYEVSDDYGVTAADAHLTLVPSTAAEAASLAAHTPRPPGVGDMADTPWPLAGQPVTIPLPTPAARPGTSAESALENLAAHPWAGREVLVQLEARDGAGQRAFSQGTRLTLPERVFLDPMARALVEQRRLLATNPAAPFQVAVALEALTTAPDRFIDDSVAYLALRSAFWRLTHAPRPGEVREVYDMLWDIALRLEDGDLSQARDRLRQIQRLLSEALNRNAPASEIRQLMAQLREALDQYLAELMQQADQVATDPNAETLGADDLDTLMQSIEQMAELGAHDQARRMLAELNQLLDGLRPAMAGGPGGSGQGGAPSPQEQALNGALNALSDVISGQRSLMDETYREVAPEGLSGDQRGQSDPLREALRRAFGDAPNTPRKRPRQGADNMARPGAGGSGGGDPFAHGAPRNDALRRILRERMPGDTNSRAPGQRGFGQTRPVDPAEADRLAREQDALREALDAVTSALDEAGLSAPEPLRNAGEAMDGASQDLRRPDFDQALDRQGSALDRLRAGADAMANELLERQGRRQGSGGVAQRDPLGRGPGTGANTGTLSLPDTTGLQRAREVLEELRRRSGERTRPRLELDYYERLLRQF